jgi:hypothetical protein
LIDIESALRHYSAEVDSASYSFYMWKAIHEATANADVLEAMNRNPLSWSVMLHALQTTYFIALGRLFDSDRRSLSVHKLLRLCADHAEEFSRERLRERKLALGFRDAEQLERYLAATYEPISSDFDVLLPKADAMSRVFKEKYQPIRHKHLAHRDLAHLGSVNVLYQKTDVGEVEALLRFTYAIERYVWELFNNGRKYDLGDLTSDVHERVEEDVTQLLGSLIRAEHSAPTH